MTLFRRLSLIIYKLPLTIVAVWIIASVATHMIISHERGALGEQNAARHLAEIGWPLLAGSVIIGLAGLFVTRAVTRPLLRVGSAISQVAKGSYDGEVPGTDRKDEIGWIARAVARLRDDLGAREAVVARQAAVIEAIDAAQAMIEFDPRGTILRANKNFLGIMGYSEAEVVGRPHATFVYQTFAASAEYRRMWDTLASGLPVAGIFPRLAKDGSRLFLQGTYSAVRDGSGAVARVIYVGSDVTVAETERRRLETEARDQAAVIEAISGGPQGMIEFDPTGRILRANQVLLDIMGYGAAEAVGRKHATFVDPKFAETDEYRRMWERLGNGEALRGTFRRVAKGGKVVYLQGTYSPVLDQNGKVTRVVKVVSDVTAAETERLGAIEQRAEMEAERSRVVAQLSAGLAKLAGGDLTIRIGEAFPTEYETLRANFNGAVEKLETAIAAVVVASGSIRDESLRISQAADDLSHRTENQAAALEETAASLEQLTASVRAAASGAEKASLDVAATRRSAEESGRIVRQAVDAMSEIEKSSQHISQIIGVIDDIAFQTNLLALNAGVEAARAGEAGRGFAVVASEVRALAQRSSAAAKEIKALISTSSQQVGRGVELVDDTGKALRVIVESVAGITAVIADIANSSREQSVGLSEINTAINQLDQVTQQNAAMVEDSTSASHAMKSEAEALTSLVAQFSAETAQVAAQVTRLPARGTEARKTRARNAAAAAKPVPARAEAGSPALAVARRSTLDEWHEF